MDNESILQLNDTIDDKFKKLLISQAKFVNGSIVFNVYKKDFCLVFDTSTQSFKNKQFYLHPELRDSEYVIYSGTIPKAPKIDFLVVTYNVINELMTKRA
jgi:hypothetical protein